MSRSTILFLVLMGLHQLVCSQSNSDDYWLNNGFSDGETVTVNSGWFYDDGGDGLYNEGQDWNVTFCSENGNPITLDFSGFKTHFGGVVGDTTAWLDYDYISVNYTGINGYVAYHDDTPEFSFTSPDGCIDIGFISNSDGLVDSGWVAEIFAIPPPFNNDPFTAEELVVGNSCSPSFYTNKGAYDTTSLGSPGCKTFFGGDVWFQLVVPDSGVVKIETFPGTLTYAILDIYNSSDAVITSDERIACVDDGGMMPAVTLTSADGIVPGDVLYIRLFGEQAKSGLFGICATDPSEPVTGYTGPGGVGDSASLDFWYKADRGLLNGGSAVVDGGQVETWEDQSGNDAHLEQSNSSYQPIYMTDTVNGFGAVSFDGFDDSLTYNLGTAGAPLHWFAAGAFDGNTRQTMLSVGDAASDKTASISRDTDGRYFSFTGAERYGPVLTDTQFSLFNSAHLLAAPYHFLELNGASQTVDAEVEPLLSNGVVQIGASWDGNDPFNGYVSELIQFSKSLNSAQEIIINNYLSAKYDIALSANDLYAYKDTFYFDVAGIGRVNAGNMHTKAESAGILAISGASDLGDDEFLFFGHDNGDFSTWSDANIPVGDTNIVRLDRVWKVGLAGLPGEVSVSLTKSVLPPLPVGFSAYNILIDNDGDFSSGAMAYGPFEIGSELVMNHINLSDGDHIAIAAVRPVVSFTTAAESAFESVNNPQIEVVLNYAVSTVVEIGYNVVEATATQGVDFSLLPSTISINPGNKSGFIAPLIIDDTIPEIPDEYFDIEISTSTSGVIAGGITRVRHTILNDDLAIEVSASDTVVGECAASESEITVEATGTGPFTYSWTPGTGLNVTDNDTVLANPSVTTTYTVEVTDTYGLSKTKDIEIEVVPLPAAPTITADGATAFCSGDSLKLSAPTGYASYLWSTAEATDSIWVKATGDYNVIVTDSFDCISPVSADISITVNPLPDNSLVVDDPAAAVCEGITATITLIGSENGVSYQLRLDSDDSEVGAPVAGDGGDIAFTVTPGATSDYNILATNITTVCSAELTDKSTVSVNPLPDNSLVVDDPAAAVCDGETATITVSGSESGVSYQLRLESDDSEVGAPVAGNNGDITFAVTPGATTDYYVIATEGTTGCSAELVNKPTVTVNPLPDNSLVVDDPAVCDGATATITVSGSESGVNYQLRLDSDDSEVGGAVEGNDGEITFTVTPGATTDYYVIATDGTTGCSAELTDKSTVTVNPLPDNSLVVDDPAVCDGATATITVSGSESGVNYQLRLDSDDSEVGVAVEGNDGEITFTVTPGATTDYNILATNITTGCSAELTDKSTVTVNPLPDNSLVVDDPAVCDGATATITVSGSESGVNYQLRLDSDDSEVGVAVEGNDGAITFTVTPGATTDYNILATNITTGCSAELTDKSTVTLNPLPDKSLVVDDPAVCDGATATITVSGSESGVNYQLRLDSDDSEVGGAVEGNDGEITFTVTPGATTDYNILATNITTDCSAELTDKATVTLNPLPDQPVITADGSLFVITGNSVLLSGPVSAAYLWEPGGETTPSISVSASGSYSLFVENEFGCTSPESDPVEVVVSDFLPPPTVTVTGSLDFCDGGSVMLTGPDGFEQYNWSDGSTGQSISVTEEVEITLVVTNNGGVQSLPSDLLTVVVYEIPEIQILDKIEPSCAAFDDGSITVGVTGGLAPYQYSWQGFQESSSTLSGIPAGNYTSTVIDENGCEESLGIELDEPAPITVEEVVEPVYCPDFSDGSIELVISGGTASYYISWSGGGTADYLNNLSPGDYSYEVKDGNNCQVDGTIQLGYENEVCFIVPGIITPNDDGFNDTWRIDGLEVYPDVIVEIFDRWGKQVFYSEGYDTDFDGTFDGRELPMESYHYMIDLNNGTERIIGNITIVR